VYGDGKIHFSGALNLLRIKPTGGNITSSATYSMDVQMCSKSLL
jgi:hypothetical protein